MKRFWLTLLGLAVAASAVLTVYLCFFASGAKPAVALGGGVPVSALESGPDEMLAAGSLDAQKKSLADLVDSVAAAGCNTLYFSVNTGTELCYKDTAFSLRSELSYRLLSLIPQSFDAVDYLGGKASDAKIRLIAVLDVSGLSGGKDPSRFLSDETFFKNLSHTIRTLGKKSGISAIVLRFDTAPEDTPQNRQTLTSLLAQSAVPCGLELPASSSLLTAEETGAGLAVARLDSETDAKAVDSYGALSFPVLWKAQDDQVFTAGAYYTAFCDASFENIIWGSVSELTGAPDRLSSLEASLETAKLSFSLPAVPQNLLVSYPADGETLYSEDVYVMGTSDPAQPLTVNGAEITRTATNGVFGTLVPLEEGENTITLAQGGTTVTLTVTRARYTYSGVTQWDATTALPAGSLIRVKSYLCSVLSDPDNEDAINETAKEGGVAEVTDSRVTVRSGKYTYAYELASGGWIMAYHCEAAEDLPEWRVAEPAVQDDGRDEKWLLVEDGTPLAYDAWDEDGRKLTVTLARTSADAPSYTPDSHFLSRVDCEETDGGVRLTFTVGGDRQLWGYDIQYDENGNTVLYLKGAPTLALDTAQPLRGATILLDAGHGGDERGATGLVGDVGGPAEKDVNLAVALATQARLTQLGATVIMTRTDDSTVSLEARSRLAADTHPDLFLAMHHNSAELVHDGNTLSGCSAYFFTLQGKALADAVLTRVANATGRVSGGSAWNYFYVNRMTYTPSVLFEYGFMINPAELQACCDTKTIAVTANATAEGIVAYFTGRLQNAQKG